jgi:hypothetical protein
VGVHVKNVAVHVALHTYQSNCHNIAAAAAIDEDDAVQRCQKKRVTCMRDGRTQRVNCKRVSCSCSLLRELAVAAAGQHRCNLPDSLPDGLAKNQQLKQQKMR